MAMKIGLAGYFEKSGVFERIGIGLSGGKDSFLTLVVAWMYAKEKFGDDQNAIHDFIRCYSMPTRYNSDTTRSIARKICQELGVTFKEVPIADAFEQRLKDVQLATGREVRPLTSENIQARIRGGFMWDLAAEEHFLWLHTGNLTENAVGYTTLGGDIMGGFSLIGDLPKSVIIKLLEYLATKYEWESLKTLLATKASAELADNQEDERELGPFEVLDTMVALVAGEKFGPLKTYRAVRGKYSDEDLCALASWYKSGDLKIWVKRFMSKFFGSEFKRMQMPQAVHLGAIDLDRDRALHLPVLMSLDWMSNELKLIDEEPD